MRIGARVVAFDTGDSSITAYLTQTLDFLPRFSFFCHCKFNLVLHLVNVDIFKINEYCLVELIVLEYVLST